MLQDPAQASLRCIAYRAQRDDSIALGEIQEKPAIFAQVQFLSNLPGDHHLAPFREPDDRHGNPHHREPPRSPQPWHSYDKL